MTHLKILKCTCTCNDAWTQNNCTGTWPHVCVLGDKGLATILTIRHQWTVAITIQFNTDFHSLKI